MDWTKTSDAQYTDTEMGRYSITQDPKGRYRLKWGYDLIAFDLPVDRLKEVAAEHCQEKAQTIGLEQTFMFSPQELGQAILANQKGEAGILPGAETLYMDGQVNLLAVCQTLAKMSQERALRELASQAQEMGMGYAG